MYLARAHAEDQRPGSLPYTRSGHPLLPFLAPRTSTKMHPIEQGRPVKPEAGSRALPSRWLQVRGWGIGSCLLQPSATHPGLQASPWVSKQEAAQRGVLFFPVTSLPSSPSFKQRGEAAVPRRVRQHHPSRGSGAGGRELGGAVWQSWRRAHHQCGHTGLKGARIPRGRGTGTGRWRCTRRGLLSGRNAQ